MLISWVGLLNGVSKMIIPSCVLFYSLLAGIDPTITNAIIKVESTGNPFAVGQKDDSGLMQVRHRFVPETQQQLFNPCTNIYRGVQILKEAKEKCVHQLEKTWVVCYNLGIAGGRKIKHPKLFPYYKKVMKNL
jgi:soluble lytic murein transglycosylase-like protein